MVNRVHTFGPDEVKELGVVSQTVPAEQFMQAARALAAVFCGKPRDVMRLERQVFREASDPHDQAAVNSAIDNFSHVAGLPDAQEGFAALAAFAQKRKPKCNGP